MRKNSTQNCVSQHVVCAMHFIGEHKPTEFQTFLIVLPDQAETNVQMIISDFMPRRKTVSVYIEKGRCHVRLPRAGTLARRAESRNCGIPISGTFLKKWSTRNPSLSSSKLTAGLSKTPHTARRTDTSSTLPSVNALYVVRPVPAHCWYIARSLLLHT